MNRRILASCLCIIASAALVTAQGGPPQEPGRGPGMRGLGPGGAGIDIMGVEPIEFGEPVLGAPFSASAITEMAQDLPDGNRIERRSTSTIARDGSGRTRREQNCHRSVLWSWNQRLASSPSAIRCSECYLLDPIRKIATKSARRRHRQRAADRRRARPPAPTAGDTSDRLRARGDRGRPC